VYAAIDLLARPALLAATLTAFLVQASLAVGLTALVTRIVPGSSAAARSSVWTWAFGALLLLPVAPIVLARWHLPLFIADANPYPALWLALPSGPYPGAALLLVLLGGAAARLGRLGRDAASVAAITRASVDLPEAPATRLAQRLAAAAGIRRGVRVVYTDELLVPATWRLWRPVILLPERARHWSAERARPVLRHELGHIRRQDYAAHLAAEVACAIHWMNPLVRWAADRLRDQQEAACDDEVLRAGTRPHEYAGILLGFAHDVRARQPVGRCALTMASSATLKGRVRDILAYSNHRTPTPRLATLGLGCAVFACALAATSVSLWACAPATLASDAPHSAADATPAVYADR
jgi:beta-lactamase regulating signal transducer with metallopeptidase domain